MRIWRMTALVASPLRHRHHYDAHKTKLNTPNTRAENEEQPALLQAGEAPRTAPIPRLPTSKLKAYVNDMTDAEVLALASDYLRQAATFTRSSPSAAFHMGTTDNTISAHQRKTLPAVLQHWVHRQEHANHKPPDIDHMIRTLMNGAGNNSGDDASLADGLRTWMLDTFEAAAKSMGGKHYLSLAEASRLQQALQRLAATARGAQFISKTAIARVFKSTTFDDLVLTYQARIEALANENGLLEKSVVQDNPVLLMAYALAHKTRPGASTPYPEGRAAKQQLVAVGRAKNMMPGAIKRLIREARGQDNWLTTKELSALPDDVQTLLHARNGAEPTAPTGDRLYLTPAQFSQAQSLYNTFNALSEPQQEGFRTLLSEEDPTLELAIRRAEEIFGKKQVTIVNTSVEPATLSTFKEALGLQDNDWQMDMLRAARANGTTQKLSVATVTKYLRQNTEVVSSMGFKTLIDLAKRRGGLLPEDVSFTWGRALIDTIISLRPDGTGNAAGEVGRGADAADEIPVSPKELRDFTSSPENKLIAERLVTQDLAVLFHEMAKVTGESDVMGMANPPDGLQIISTRRITQRAAVTDFARTLLIPSVVAQVVTAEDLMARERIVRDKFKSNMELPGAERVQYNDYTGSGRDRGHLSPASDGANQRNVSDSFFMSNMSSQTTFLNREVLRRFEVWNRALIVKSGGRALIYSGNLFDPNTPTRYIESRNSDKKISVPDYVFKTMVLRLPDGTVTTQSWLLPNIDSPLSEMPNHKNIADYIEAQTVSIDQIERMAKAEGQYVDILAGIFPPEVTKAMQASTAGLKLAPGQKSPLVKKDKGESWWLGPVLSVEQPWLLDRLERQLRDFVQPDLTV